MYGFSPRTTLLPVKSFRPPRLARVPLVLLTDESKSLKTKVVCLLKPNIYLHFVSISSQMWNRVMMISLFGTPPGPGRHAIIDRTMNSGREGCNFIGFWAQISTTFNWSDMSEYVWTLHWQNMYWQNIAGKIDKEETSIIISFSVIVQQQTN